MNSMTNEKNREKTRMEINNLVQQAKAGSSEAAEQLLSRFKPLIYATIKRHHTGSEWEDMLQSAALFLLEGIKDYDAQTGIPFLAYIKTKLNFDIYNLCRRQRNIMSYHLTIGKDDPDPLSGLVDESADIQLQVLRNEQINALHEALSELQPRHREVIVLYFFKNLTLKEIAKRMGISYKTAQRYKARGMERLAGLLGE
jgi:RNA polymerase sigma factor (sigma-70 family)